MKFYRQKSNIWDLFDRSLIHSIIAPFGFEHITPAFDFENKARIICLPHKAYVERSKKYNADIKTIPRIHAKLAVGCSGVLFGSFNFTKSKLKECVVFSEAEQDIEDAMCEFDYYWDKGTLRPKQLVKNYNKRITLDVFV
jgi:hypothetical protein